MLKYFRYCFLLGVFAHLSACGFHLPSNISVNQSLQPVCIQGAPNQPQHFVRQLEQALITAGVKVAHRSQANSILTLHSFEHSTRSLSLSRNARNAEIQSQLSINYSWQKITPSNSNNSNQADNNKDYLIAPSDLQKTTVYINDVDNPLLLLREEKQSQQDLEKQLIELLLMRMQHVD